MIHPDLPPEGAPSAVMPEDPVPSGGAWSTIWHAFLDPVAAFRNLAVHPHWVVALVVVILVSLGTQVVVANRIDLEQVIRRGIAERQQEGRELSDTQLEQAVKGAKAFSRVAMLSAPVVVPAIFALLAGIYLGLLRLVGSEVGFKALFATVLHAALPAAVVSALLTIVVVSQRTELDPSNMGGVLTSNLAALLPAGTAKPLTALASVLDIFNVWQWVLLVLGFTVVARVRRSQAIAVVAVAWGAWALLRVGLALLR